MTLTFPVGDALTADIDALSNPDIVTSPVVPKRTAAVTTEPNRTQDGGSLATQLLNALRRRSPSLRPAMGTTRKTPTQALVNSTIQM